MKNTILSKQQIKTFILCWLAYASIYFCRVNLAVSIPEIHATLGWSKTQLGLIGSVFFWVYGFGHLFNGYIGDKVSSRVYIFIGLFVAGSMNIFFGFSSSLIAFMVIWSINGFSQSMVWGPMVKSLSSWFPEELSSKVAIWISTSMVGGYMLAWGFSTQVLKIADWRWTFWIPGGIVVCYSVIWLIKFRNTPKDAVVALEKSKDYDQCESDDQTSLTLWQVIVKTKLWYVVVACIAQGIIKEGISLWGPTFLIETQNIDMSSSSMIMIIPVMNFIGIFFAGWLNRKLKLKEKLTCSILLVIGVAMIVCLVSIGGKNMIAGTLFLGGASAAMYGANSLLLGIIPMKFAKYKRVSSIAGFLDFTSYVSAGLASLLTGIIADKSGWNGVLVLWISVSVCGVISLLVSLKTTKE